MTAYISYSSSTKCRHRQRKANFGMFLTHLFRKTAHRQSIDLHASISTVITSSYHMLGIPNVKTSYASIPSSILIIFCW